jgi:DNA-binding response OmpR family regulator
MNLREGFITVGIEPDFLYGKRVLRLNVADSGLGFDWSRLESATGGGPGTDRARRPATGPALTANLAFNSQGVRGDRADSAARRPGGRGGWGMTARLLVVDDDVFIRELMREVLGQCGYEVDTAEDGEVAWEGLDADPARHDLVLLDKQMPRLDGISLLRRIRGDGRFADLPVIMLTADTSPEDVSQGLAEGAHYYLTKPSTEDVLKVVIKSTLAEFRQKRELRALVGRHAGTLGLLCHAEFAYRTLDEARDLALLLADASMESARTVVGYSELLINAVEHGNLGIGYARQEPSAGRGPLDRGGRGAAADPAQADEVGAGQAGEGRGPVSGDHHRPGVRLRLEVLPRIQPRAGVRPAWPRHRHVKSGELRFPRIPGQGQHGRCRGQAARTRLRQGRLTPPQVARQLPTFQP